MELSLKSTINLNNDVKMPLLGLRVYKMKGGEETYKTVRDALDVGYRLIDTARIYCNEKAVGKAVRDSGIPRNEIFVTTKLWVTDFDNPRQALLDSLKRLGLDYVDLYLIHWPVKGYEKAYLELEKLQQEGLCRAIGVFECGRCHDVALGVRRKRRNQRVPHCGRQDGDRLFHGRELLYVCDFRDERMEKRHEYRDSAFGVFCNQ